MDVLAGRYELGEQLGAGAVGRVLVAHDRMLGRDVAVKLVSREADETTRHRFLREARAAARLHHPNTVAIYDTGEEDGQPYLVMELVRGRSLADVLADDGPMDIEEAVAVTAGVLTGLEVAHRAGMVHRDVKPANVLLPDEGGVKLSDFGIAKALDEADAEITAVGTLMGTPTYLAPELLVGDAPSPASDVYSVGCLLYALLTGDPPFTRGEPMAIAYAHRNEPVPPLTERRAEVGDDLVAVVSRALAKDPADRFASAASMHTALLDGPVPAAGDAAATMAIGGAGAEGARVLDAGDEATRALAASAAGGGADPAAVAAPDKRRRRWIPVAVIAALLVGLVVWLAWPDATGDPADDEVEEEEFDEAPEDPEDLDDEPEDPADPDPPADVPDADAPDDDVDDAPPTDDPADDVPPEDDPGDDPTDDDPADDDPTEDDPVEDDPADDPGEDDGDDTPEDEGALEEESPQDPGGEAPEDSVTTEDEAEQQPMVG